MKPDKAGIWRNKTTGQNVEFYPLEPVGGTLCCWGPDIGLTFTEMCSGTEVWSDEWQGHVPTNTGIIQKDEWEEVPNG